MSQSATRKDASQGQKEPAVSVIVPTYRHRDYVLKTLDSVFAQTFKDYEVIVVNDGSPDDTDAVLRPLVEASKIRYIRQANAGQGAARNRGIAEASGEFIALLDDDDLWPADKLAWQVNALRGSPEAALVYGRVLAINESDAFFTPLNGDGAPEDWLSLGPGGDVSRVFVEKNRIVSPGQVLLRRSALQSLGERPFDPAIKGGCDDWELYLRLSQTLPFVAVDRVALHYRIHSANASRDTVAMYFSNLAVRRKMYRTETDPGRRAEWRASYRAYADWLVLAALKSFSDQRLRSEGWTSAVAFGCLGRLAPFVPSGIARRIGARIGMTSHR